MRNWRINLILILILLFPATIISRLVFLQILHHDFYKALAQGQQKIPSLTQGDRGDIFFKDGQILATNVKEKFVYISPLEIKVGEFSDTAKKIAEILNLEEDWILEKAKKNSLFEPIKYKLSEKEIENLKKESLSGVYLADYTQRNYPQGSLAAQVVGFFGGNEIGQYGIEGYYDDILQGKEGLGEKAVKGSDLVLTLDYNVQFMAEQLLEKAKETLDIEGGQILVLNPVSGKIIVLSNFPSFDPNRYNEYAEDENLKIFQNSIIQKLFEPGSAFKPATMAAALDQGKITPQTAYIDTGVVKIGGWPIYNYEERVHGEQTMTQVLEKSINTGAVWAEQQLGHKLFLEYIDKFGFFEPTKIDLEGEIFSENEEFKKGYEINFATASYGQGIEITPIQLAQAFSAIANGGKLIRPYLVEKIVNSSSILNSFSEKEQSENSKQVISHQTASQLTAMLVSVVENGFGRAARVPGYFIAGKTGTAQISWSSLGIDKRGYSDKTWQTFVGFGPIFDPQFLILVKLDNPKTKTAEYSAVPIFQKLAKYIIDYYQIPPDYEL